MAPRVCQHCQRDLNSTNFKKGKMVCKECRRFMKEGPISYTDFRDLVLELNSPRIDLMTDIIDLEEKFRNECPSAKVGCAAIVVTFNEKGAASASVETNGVWERMSQAQRCDTIMEAIVDLRNMYVTAREEADGDTTD